MNMDHIPSSQEISNYLAADYRLDQQRARDWAKVLHGLPWRYVKPLVQMAVNSGNHPAIALALAAKFSEDAEFVGVAHAHLDKLGLVNARKRYIACGTPAEVNAWREKRGLQPRDVVQVSGNPDRLIGITGPVEVVRFKSHSRNPRRRQIEEQIRIIIASTKPVAE